MNKKHNLLQTPEERFRDENITNKIEITKSNLFNGRDNDGYIDLTPTFENIGEIKYLSDSLGSQNKFFIEGYDFKIMVKEVSKNSLTCFGPLVYYELAKQIELKALGCDIAKYKDKKFIVSDCFLDKDELLVTGSKLISHSVLKNLKKGVTSNLNEYIVSANCLEKAELLITNYKMINDGDLKIILNDLFKMYLLDNLCDNKDRHEGNWGIIYTDDKGASLAPVYDNEFIFNLENRDNVIFNIIAKSNYSNLQTKPSPLRFRLSCNSRHLSSLEELEILFKSSNDHTKKEILELINKLDVYSAIKEVELKVNHSLPNKIKKLITNTFKINKDLALSTLTKDKPHIK